MSFNNILTHIQGNAFVITINRENKLNALNHETLQEIKTAVLSVQENASIRGIILTGSGTKAFAAGADIAEFAKYNAVQGTKLSADGHLVMDAIETSKIPVIAAVNGFRLGGGCELAMACHIRIASDNAKFGQPEVNLGLPPGYAGTQRLVQLVGKAKALEMLLTAEIISASDALNFGLVTKVVTQDKLMETAFDMVQKLSTKSPMAIQAVIQCVNTHFESTRPGFEAEISKFGQAFGTSDFNEGTKAFMEKRSPAY